MLYTGNSSNLGKACLIEIKKKRDNSTMYFQSNGHLNQTLNMTKCSLSNHILTCHDHIQRMLRLSSKNIINLLHTPQYTPTHTRDILAKSTKSAGFDQSALLSAYSFYSYL